MKRHCPEISLTEEEKTKPYANYFYKEPAAVPEEILRQIDSGAINSADALRFENKNDLLKPGYLARETGWCFMPDANCYAAVLTKMPRVTGEMLDWWFCWHPSENLRYKIWYPAAHFASSAKNMDQLTNPQLSNREKIWNNTVYPVEDVGIGADRLFIHFLPPKDFGFDTSRFAEAKVATVICAIVGFAAGGLQHTYMCHYVRNIEGGVEMRSRFWIGHTIRLKFFSRTSLINRLANTKLVRRLAIPGETPYKMALHCAQEYNNLAVLLPELYRDYGNREEAAAP